MNKPTKESLLRYLSGFGQEHVLAFWDRLDLVGRETLANQILNLDFFLYAKILPGKERKSNWAIMASRVTSPPAFRINSTNTTITPDQALERGQAVLRKGRVGAVIVAGGTGSRLAFCHPKGMFPVGPVSHHSLFQVLIHRLRAVSNRYEVRIPLIILTSAEVHSETCDYLAQNDRFGLRDEDLSILCQSSMPAVDAQTRKLLLASEGSLALSPDGHGGLIAAMRDGGCFHEARQHGIEHYFYCQVDNPLVQMCDPLMIGYHILSGSEATTQVVEKNDPSENAGIAVSLDDRVHIIEYSDLPEELAQQRALDGTLEFWAGNTAVHVFDLAFLERMSVDTGILPYHRAIKKVQFIDSLGNLVIPDTPNAIKFERFIFDLLPAARNALVMEARRCEAFAPIKNAAETDSPMSAKKAMCALYKRWLEAAGAIVDNNVDVEIDPLYALDVEELSEKVKPGLRISRATYFSQLSTNFTVSTG